jgi:hypothetical protein
MIVKVVQLTARNTYTTGANVNVDGGSSFYV